MGSNPPGRFSDLFLFLYLSFMLAQVNFGDVAILCNGPNNCCQQSVLTSLYFL